MVRNRLDIFYAREHGMVSMLIFFWHGFSSLLAGFYTYEGVQLASYLGKPNDPEFIEKGGGWDKWTCIAYHHPM